ncbi:hypothetical protein HJG60_010270 [Phyllostomus discolor]|uniref:Uncharacterized protein n=1 Tax=Phyllostomus discolor TaxID=89673 RepID=A0A834EMS3_9CHIR|nr:hypothetical protein HJG60_010270 [Phyllostomus discolor]
MFHLFNFKHHIGVHLEHVFRIVLFSFSFWFEDVYLYLFYFNCCSSTIFYLLLPSQPTHPALRTSLPFPPTPSFCPCALYTCSCKSFPFSPEIPSPLPSIFLNYETLQPLLGFQCCITHFCSVTNLCQCTVSP